MLTIFLVSKGCRISRVDSAHWLILTGSFSHNIQANYKQYQRLWQLSPFGHFSCSLPSVCFRSESWGPHYMWKWRFLTGWQMFNLAAVDGGGWEYGSGRSNGNFLFCKHLSIWYPLSDQTCFLPGLLKYLPPSPHPLLDLDWEAEKRFSVGKVMVVSYKSPFPGFMTISLLYLPFIVKFHGGWGRTPIINPHGNYKRESRAIERVTPFTYFCCWIWFMILNVVVLGLIASWFIASWNLRTHI